ncbi:hypothetical protein WJX77_007134 [Trebouxia sp. C0004]
MQTKVGRTSPTLSSFPRVRKRHHRPARPTGPRTNRKHATYDIGMRPHKRPGQKAMYDKRHGSQLVCQACGKNNIHNPGIVVAKKKATDYIAIVGKLQDKFPGRDMSREAHNFPSLEEFTAYVEKQTAQAGSDSQYEADIKALIEGLRTTAKI